MDHDVDASSADHLLEVEEAELSSEEDQAASRDDSASASLSPSPHLPDGPANGDDSRPAAHLSDGDPVDEHDDDANFGSRSLNEQRDDHVDDSAPEDDMHSGEGDSYNHEARNAAGSSDRSDIDEDVADDGHEVLNGASDAADIQSSDGNADEHDPRPEDDANDHSEGDDEEEEDASMRFHDPVVAPEDDDADGDVYDPEDEMASGRDDLSAKDEDVSSAQDESDDSGNASEDVALDADADDDDDDPGEAVIRRPARRAAPLKIPEELLDDGEYFRRSRRQRHAVSRYTVEVGGESSEAPDENDSDFHAGNEEEDDDVPNDDEGDEDFGEFKPKSKGRSRKVRRRPRRTQSAAQLVSDEDVGERLDASEETSDSDGDWACRPSSGKRRIGRRKPKRRARVSRKSSDDDESTRTARVNARTGGAINYAEAGDSDSDIFDEVDAAANRAAKLEAASGDAAESQPRIASICDYRVPSQEASVVSNDERASKQTRPFDDFDPDIVEFNINWAGVCFRKNSWHKLEELKHFKGFKKVTNYVRDVLLRRDQLRQSTVTPEELEEAAVIFMENRKALEEFTVVERIVTERQAKDTGETEYLVKWQNLEYRDCTWESASFLDSPSDLKAVDAYSDRVQGAVTAGSSGKSRRFNPFGKEPREKFRKMKEQPKYLHGDGRTLREYQLAGLNWLAFSWSNNRNVILADEMGLGKTLQTISFLGWIMYQRHVHGPFLVVVPLSTIAAWVREFARWVPEMNVVCYTGNAASRAVIREHEFEPPGASRSRGNSVGFHALLTTPELVMNDIDHLLGFRWAMIAVDEAHRLKNKEGELHRSLAALTSANRLLITGTPLQNSVVELWALLHFLNPEQFDDANSFEEQFSFAALRDEVRVANLHDTLRPYIIRRQKVDVEKSLPQKTYSLLRVGMASEQQNLYRLLLTKNYAKLNAGKSKGKGPVVTLRNLVMELKKCCNHPFLFDNFEDTTTSTTVETLTRASGKMILLDKLLLRLREKGHRVLVFSQMVRMLDILSDYCRMRGFLYQRLDGSMPNDLRVRAVDHFNAPGSTDFMFLLSTRAGGLGINLATADTVIIFDSDWNPQNDLQAESRAHRIGQTKDVKVFRLVSRDTVEEDILERAKRKRVLEHLVIHGVEGDEQEKDGKVKFNKKELSAILRFGAEKLFKETTAVGDDGSHPQGASSVGENGGRIPSTGDDVKAEEKRVMEVDDIDELLARAPVEPEEQLGAAEANMGDSLLNAFKWADFDPVADDDNEDGEIVSAPSEMLAKDAAREISALDEKRKRDIAKARAKQEREDADMAEDDAQYWARVIPEDMKNGAIALDDDLILGTRRRKRTKTYGAAESPQFDQKRKRSRRGLHPNGTSAQDEDRELSRKEQRVLLRSWRKFGSPSRVEDILRDASLGNRIEADKAHGVLEDTLRIARQELRKANSSLARSRQEETMKDSSEKTTAEVPGVEEEKRKSVTKAKGPPPVLVPLLGEQVNARELIKRVDEMELLGRRITQTSKGDTHFRLRRPIKAPAYGVPWKSKHDAMLLVGIHRHGLGNWVRVAADDDLMLGDKMTVPGGVQIKGAPDATKLARRAAALLKELVAEEKQTSANLLKPTSKASRAGRSKNKAGTLSRGSKRPRGEAETVSLSAKRPRTKLGQSKANSKPEPVGRSLAEQLKRSHRGVLKDFRKLSGHNSSLDKSEIIRRTRDCLLELGAEIEKLSENDKARSRLWAFVHTTCRTHLPGERLALLYDKVLAEKKRASSACS